MNLDDVFVFRAAQERHLEDLDAVLEFLGLAGVTLTLKKLSFYKERVDYLGHFIMPVKLAASMDPTKATRKLAFRSDLTNFRSSLGACNVYRRFVHGYVKL